MQMFVKPVVKLTALNATGTHIVTEEYGTLVDYEAGCWANVLGHGRPEVVKTITENGEKLFHTHQFFETEHPKALVKELAEAAELFGEYSGTFISSGSEAVSLAVTLAELLTGRKRKMSFTISYLSTAPELRMPRNPETWLDLDISECLKCNKECKKCEKVKGINFRELAAFVFEPGNSGGLVLCPPDQLITHLVEKTRDGGGLIIANEVTTGFGRTGKWFGFQHYSVFDSIKGAPDFISMGKGLGNGYPISGVLAKAELGKKVEETEFRYVQSHIDDPMGCMVSRKVIELMLKEKAVERADILGEHLRKRLGEIGERTGLIKEIRGRGLMNAVILENSLNSKVVFQRLLELGCFVGFSEVYHLLRFYPALIISKEEIDDLCYKLELAITENPVVKTKDFSHLEKVQRLLSKTYWAEGRTEEKIKTSLRNSLCYAIYDKEDREKLIGFARVVTDYSTTYWLCDVVVDEEYRGNGTGKKLVEAVCLDPELRDMKGRLATKDAFGLYEKYGYVKEPVKSMTREAQ